MSGEPTTNDTEPCSEFQTYRYVIVSLLSASTAFLSALACLMVIGLLLAFKKHRFFVQRLILYLCVSALINSLTIGLRLQNIGNNIDSVALHRLCIFTAFLDQVTAWSELLAIVCITLNLFVNVVFSKDTTKLEPFYFVLIFIVPFLFNWVPFIEGSYGTSGAWCWIRSLNETSCEKHTIGFAFQYVLWYVPFYVILSIIMLEYLFIIYKVFRQRNQWEGKYEPHVEAEKEMMQQEVWPLIFYPFGYLILNTFPLINRVQGTISPNNPVYALWILHAIFSPLQGGYIALVFTLKRDTLRKLNCANLRANLFQRNTAIKEYPVKNGRSDSFPVVDTERDRDDKVVHTTQYRATDSSGSIVEPV